MAPCGHRLNQQGCATHNPVRSSRTTVCYEVSYACSGYMLCVGLCCSRRCAGFELGHFHERRLLPVCLESLLPMHSCTDTATLYDIPAAYRCEYRYYYAKLNGVPSGASWEEYCPGKPYVPLNQISSLVHDVRDQAACFDSIETKTATLRP